MLYYMSKPCNNIILYIPIKELRISILKEITFKTLLNAKAGVIISKVSKIIIFLWSFYELETAFMCCTDSIFDRIQISEKDNL